LSFFHYTSLEGIKGIVENKEMWGTHINFLNDRKEFVHLDSVLNEAISELELPFYYGNKIYKTHEDISKDIKPWDRGRINENNYILSFSQVADCKSQWMEYCPKYAGYALEFSEFPLLPNDRIIHRGKGYESGFDSSRPQQCIYERREQIELIKSEILNLKNTCKFEESILQEISIVLSDLKYRFKHHGFSEERECRWYGRGDSKMNMRISNGIMVPYVKVPIDITKLSSIWVGPSPVQDKAAQGLSFWWSALQRSGIGKGSYTFKNDKTGVLSIRRSEIPYSFI